MSEPSYLGVRSVLAPSRKFSEISIDGELFKQLYNEAVELEMSVHEYVNMICREKLRRIADLANEIRA